MHLTANRLAHLTKLLIAKCGGLEEASQACAEAARPYSNAQLSRCQTPGSGCFLPIDILVALESYCGEPMVSQAMFEARPGGRDVSDLMTEVSEVTEAAAAFQGKARRAAADDRFSAKELRELGIEAQRVLDQAQDAVAAVARLQVVA